MRVAALGWTGGGFPGHIATGNEEEKPTEHLPLAVLLGEKRIK